jgi:hypothetical protein
MIRRVLPWVLPLLAACPSDDDETGGNATTNDAATSPADGMATVDDGMTADDTNGTPSQTWGAPCMTDDECVTLLGAGGMCLMQAVVYELPGGYCSKVCTLTDNMTRVVPDAADCSPDGGVDCIGQSAVNFQQCAVPCTDDSDCTRDGYICRLMPLIGQDGDPKYCLMQDCCDELDCSDC